MPLRKTEPFGRRDMLTLYWEYLAGSIVVQAVLEEIGAEYRLHYVDMGADAHRAADFLRLNPTGRIPACLLYTSDAADDLYTV